MRGFRHVSRWAPPLSSSGRPRSSNNLFGDIFRCKDQVDAAAGNCTLGHVWLCGRVEFLRDGNAARFFDSAQCRRPIAIIAGDNNRDQLAVPVLRYQPANGSVAGYRHRARQRNRLHIPRESLLHLVSFSFATVRSLLGRPHGFRRCDPDAP